MKLTVSLSPHLHSNDSVAKRMWNVVIALIPALVIAFITFGLPVLWILLFSLGTCLITEFVITVFVMKKRETLWNGSAVITSILLAFNLPSNLPWWMVIIGAFVAIAIGKMSFGGLGYNIWNPALVGRVFLLLSFPAAMTTWPVDVSSPYSENVVQSGISQSVDSHSGATILSYINDGKIDLDNYNLLDMAIGNMNGSLGEVGGLAILLGLIYLLLTRTITWHIPFSVIGSAAFFSWVFGGNPILDIFAGGLLLGAVFMATDYVTSPMTHSGQIIFGVLIGLITIIIRRFGAYPEGMSFAILLMNSFVPIINRYCRPSIFGEKERRRLAS